jgi:heat shock protein HtpX
MTKEIKHIDFRDQISRNKTASGFLLGIVFIVLILLGWAITKIFRLDAFIVMSLFSIFAILYIWLTYYFSANIALFSVGAKEADKIKYRQLYNSVEGLCLGSGLPMPKVYIMEEEGINAFATGRNPKNSVVCVTTGCLAKLSKDELEGVLAHELTHIRNYDIKFVTLVAVVVGLVSIISEMFLRSLWYGGGRRDSNSNGKGDLIILLIGILLAILAPLIVKLVQLAISRKREYMSDAGAVEITRYPQGLIGALTKIKGDKKEIKVSSAVAPLFISDPLKQRFSNLFATHPPIDDRIKVLRAM